MRAATCPPATCGSFAVCGGGRGASASGRLVGSASRAVGGTCTGVEHEAGQCERCYRDARVVVTCTDSAGPWRLCSTCWIDVTTDNARVAEANRQKRIPAHGVEVAKIAPPSPQGKL